MPNSFLPMSQDIVRETALRRISIEGLRLVDFLAPAGYRKSTLARQFAARRGGTFSICDCAGLTGPFDLCRRVVAALAEVDTECSQSWSNEQIALRDNVLDWRSLAISAWTSATEPSLFLFEN